MIDSLTRAIAVGPDGMRVAHMSMWGVSRDDVGDVAIVEREFQWWPETLSDSMSAGWNGVTIPGASHNLNRWGANEGRTLSFDITLSRFLVPTEDREFSGLNSLVDVLSSTDPKNDRNARYNCDIKETKRWLRSFMYPVYVPDQDGLVMAKGPVLCAISMPNMAMNEDGSDIFYCVMETCDVQYMKTFPNGTPRLATVSLSFKQDVEHAGNVYFVSRKEMGAIG